MQAGTVDALAEAVALGVIPTEQVEAHALAEAPGVVGEAAVTKWSPVASDPVATN